MERSTLVLDACVLITFGNAGALDVLLGLSRHALVAPLRVIGEIVRPPARDAVRTAIDNGMLATTSIDLSDPLEQRLLRRFDAMPAFRNRADAEVLTIASARRCIVCSDERAVREVATAEVGRERVAGSLDVLKWAVVENRLSVAGAVKLVKRLDVGEGIERRLAQQRRTVEEILRN